MTELIRIHAAISGMGRRFAAIEVCFQIRDVFR